MTAKKNFYISIINTLKTTTNLSKISKKLGISKQNLNYYLRQLRKEGYVTQRGKGWYELTERSKNMTNHGSLLSKDNIRGHAFVWDIKDFKIPDNWKDRIQILTNKGVHFKLVGVLKDIPRIKVLERKVWLCKDKIKVYDKPKSSYYGNKAIESRKSAFNEILLIVGVLNNKLGISIKPEHIFFQKEHYAIIKNDLAIDHNRRGEIVHVSDEFGEWMLIDDSFGLGGELENIGKKALQTNIPMQKWWNDNKKHKFEVTPTFLLESMNRVSQNQEMFAKNIEKHMKVLDDMSETLKSIREELKK